MGRRQPPERIELIEVVDPANSFTSRCEPGNKPPGSAPVPGTGRRWAKLSVPAALVAVVVVSAALAWGGNDPAPSDRPPRVKAAATTSSSATTNSTGPATPSFATLPTSPTSSVASQHPEARLLGTAPFGMTLQSVSEIPDDVNSDGQQISAALWADGAHADPGIAWLHVTTTPEAFGQTFGPGQLRVATSHGVATVRSTSAGLTLSGPIDGGSATIQSSGIGVSDLVAVLDGLRRTDAGIQLDPAAVPAHCTLRGSTASGEQLWTPTYTTASFSGTPTANLRWPRGTPWLQTDVGPPPNGFAASPTDFLVIGSSEVAVAGGKGTIGPDTRAGFGLRRVSFVRDGLTVTLTAWGVSDDALVAHANSIRLYSDPGWTRLENDLHRGDKGSVGNLPDARAFPLATGILPDSDNGTWSIDYHALADQPDRLGLTVSVVPDHYRQTFDEATVARNRPSFAATATADQTFVIALVPPGSGAVALRLTLAGAVVDTVAFADVAGLDNRAAVAVFTDVGPYIAQIVAADGSVLAAYDPTSSVGP